MKNINFQFLCPFMSKKLVARKSYFLTNKHLVAIPPNENHGHHSEKTVGKFSSYVNTMVANTMHKL